MNARARLSWIGIVVLLAGTPSSYAAPLGRGNLLVSRPSGTPPTVAEYTVAGELVQTFAIVTGSGGVRGTGVDLDGGLHVQVGAAAPNLFLWNPGDGSWSSRTIAGWSTGECASCGGVGSGSDHLYATDDATAGVGLPSGLIRFDARGDGAVRFAEGTGYSDVAVGGDGMIYGRRADRASTVLDVHDPVSLARLRSVTIPHPCVAFEADAAGRLYGVFGTNVVRYAATGAVLGGRTLPIAGSLIDLARHPDGRLAATVSTGEVLVLDSTGVILHSFPAAPAGHVSFVPDYRAPLVCADSIGPEVVELAAVLERDTTGNLCVRASWTAPADSTWSVGDRQCLGGIRAAASYDLRWSESPIADEAAFDLAFEVDGESVPAAPGTPQEIVFCDAPGGAGLFLAMRSVDADGNRSGLARVHLEAPPVDTIPTERPCPVAWPYWSHSSHGWPESLTLGELSYSPAEARALLGGVEGDASRVLARQLVAAKLNLLAGADPGPAAVAVADADAAIGPWHLPIGVAMNSEEGRRMREIARVLEDFNHGKRTPGCKVARQEKDSTAGEVDGLDATLAAPLALGRVAPNPFVAAARIAFELRAAGPVRIAVYDLQGRLRRVLADGDHAAGTHAVTWDGADGQGVRLPRGIYLIRAVSGASVSVRKVTLRDAGR